jgi:hypothetical protein
MSSTAKKKNPRKYKDRIALQKQAEDAKNEEFEAIMRDLSSAKELRNSNCMLQDSNVDEGNSSLLSPNTLGPHRIRRVSDSRSSPYERSRSLSPRPSSSNNKSVILTPRDYGNLLQPPVAAAHLTRQRSDPYLARLSPPTTSDPTSSAYSSGGLTTSTYTQSPTSATNLNGLDHYVNDHQQFMQPYNGNHQDYSTSADLQVQQVYAAANNQNDTTSEHVHGTASNVIDPHDAASHQSVPNGQLSYVTNTTQQAPVGQQMDVTAGNQEFVPCPTLYTSSGQYSGSQGIPTMDSNQNKSSKYTGGGFNNAVFNNAAHEANNSQQGSPPYPAVGMPNSCSGGFNSKILDNTENIPTYSQHGSPVYQTCVMPNVSQPSTTLYQTAVIANSSQLGSPPYPTAEIQNCSLPGYPAYPSAVLSNTSNPSSPLYQSAALTNSSNPSSPAYQDNIATYSTLNPPPYLPTGMTTSNQSRSLPYPAANLPLSTQQGSTVTLNSSLPPEMHNSSNTGSSSAHLTSSNQNMNETEQGGKIHEHGTKLLYPRNSDLSTIDINDLLIGDKFKTSTPGDLIDCDILSKALKTTFEPMNSNPTAHRVQSPSRRHTSANFNANYTGNPTLAQQLSQQRRHSEGTPLITITSCDDDDDDLMAAENNFSMYRPDRKESLSDYEDEISRDSSSMPASPAGDFANLEDDNAGMSDDLKGIQLTDLNSGRVVLPDTVTGGPTDLDKLFEASFSKFQ